MTQLPVNLILLVTIIVHISLQCDQKTFQNNQITIKQNNINNILQVTGCITPQTLTKYKLNSLEYIKIRKQNLPQLNKGAIANFTDDFRLFFENNNMHTIKNGAFFNLIGVKEISATGNNLSVIEVGAFSNLPSLRTINLSKNKINFLELHTFTNLPMLLNVELQHNRLEYFEQDWFQNTSALEYLDISHNDICSIPRASFTTLPSLQWIELQYNKIQQIHKNAFQDLKNLIFLDISHNRISTFNIDLIQLESIEEILVHLNKISYIPEKILKSSLRVFLIFPNPVQCPCYDTLLKWGIDNNIKLSNYSTECINKNNPVCISLPDNSNECLENIDSETNKLLSTQFYSSFDLECDNSP